MGGNATDDMMRHLTDDGTLFDQISQYNKVILPRHTLRPPPTAVTALLTQKIDTLPVRAII